MVNIQLCAEIGINHSGSMELAKSLIRQAKDCGWHSVKFQKRTINKVYTQEFLDSPRESPWGKTQRAQKEGLEFSIEQMSELFEYARDFGLIPFASAWDTDSLHEIESLSPEYHKAASPFLTNHLFLTDMAVLGRHTLISTGGSTMYDISKAVEIFKRCHCPFTLMHCTSIYPCPEEFANIRMIQTLKNAFQCEVGYSGHEVGILPSILAAALGATVIERHITRDRSSYGSDQAASLEEHGMRQLAKYIAAIEPAMGDGVKRVLDGEKATMAKLRWWEQVA